MHRSFAEASTYEAWEFDAPAQILAISTTKDATGDGVEDVVVAVHDKSIYLVNGASGKQIWGYIANNFYDWLAVLATPTMDVNKDSIPDIVAVTKDRLVMLLDGATGKQLWNYTSSDDQYKPGDSCFPTARGAYVVSDIDNDKVPDVVVVSGSGDQCPKDDKFSALALGTKSGKKIWEFVHDEDYHGLKDETGGNPSAAVDYNQDGIIDIAIADDHSILYIIEGSKGTQIKATDLDILGEVWNLMPVPDISGDGTEDLVAMQFVEGGGGPDYASISAIDLKTSTTLWELKQGDAIYNTGALFSTQWFRDKDNTTVYVAMVRRVESHTDFVLFDAVTTKQLWQLQLGQSGGSDAGKVYPIARMPDLNGNGNEEIVLGSLNGKVDVMDVSDATVIWSHPISPGTSKITSIALQGSQRYIIVVDSLSGVHALAGLTERQTSVSIGTSEHKIPLASKLTVSGTVNPPFPGEIVNLKYVDPTGKMTSKPLIQARDGSFSDEIKPTIIGVWKVSAEFQAEGFYLNSQSPTVTFSVENETKNSVYLAKVKQEGDSTVSYPVVYLIDGGQVDSMSIDKQQKSIQIELLPFANGGTIRVELQRSTIDAFESHFQVFIDGRSASFNELDQPDDQTRVLSIAFPARANQIQIIGTSIVPEFSAIAPVALALAMVSVIVTIAIQRRGLFKRLR